MGCKSITGLVLDHQSKIRIAEIATKKKLFKALSVSLIGGTLMNILNGRNKAEVIGNIKSTDFQALSSALAGVHLIEKRVLMDIADREVATRIPSKNRLFWENISYGCKN